MKGATLIDLSFRIPFELTPPDMHQIRAARRNDLKTLENCCQEIINARMEWEAASEYRTNVMHERIAAM